MQLTNKNLIVFEENKLEKQEVLELITKTLYNNQNNFEFEQVLTGLKDREKQFSTGMENGIAIPHALVESEDFKFPKIVIIKLAHEIEWKSLDNKPTNFIIGLFVPKNTSKTHLTILSEISKLLINQEILSKIKTMNKNDLVLLFNKILLKEKNSSNGHDKNEYYDIVGITACPTGIAHTFMAAEAIENECKKRGLSVKIEKQGSTTENHLTQDEIDHAKYIILAVGRKIEKGRFVGREIYEIPVVKPMKDPVGVIDALIDPTNTKDKSTTLAKVQSTGKNITTAGYEADFTFNKFHKRLYAAILTGVSYMLPFVVFGGIMIAFSFLVDINNAKILEDGEYIGNPNYGSTSVAAQWIGGIGHLSFDIMVPVLVAYLMYGLIGKQGIMPGFVIGFIAIGNGPGWIDIFSYQGWAAEGAFSESITGVKTYTATSSGFIGGIIGGIGATALFIYLDKGFNKILPDSLHGAKLILFLPVIGTAFAATIFWFVNIPLTFVSWGLMAFLGLSNSPWTIWIFGIIIGIMMTTDYGGPINKSAYFFGVASIAGGNVGDQGSIYMAAVTAAAMLPPLGIAAATSFKRKTLWDDADISAGYTNWVLGGTMITEGAIPFATKYPKDIYWTTMIAGAFVGGLTCALGIATFAPHGGIFTFALLNCVYFDSVIIAKVFGIGLFILVLALGVLLQASLIIWRRTITVKKEQLLKQEQSDLETISPMKEFVESK